jgi:hypothetical protein
MVAVKLLWAFLKSALLVAFGVALLVFIRRISGWRPISSDPSAVSNYLSSLAQFTAVPVTLAFAIIVLVVQLQAGTVTSRAGALVVNSPQFLFTVTLLFQAPAFCIGLLGIFDLSDAPASTIVRELAFAALVPLLLTFAYLARFTNDWFRQVSPAAFTGYISTQVIRGLQEKDRDATNLAIRGLGEALNNLALSTDYTSVRLCANHIGKVLEIYIETFKAQMPDRFFYYVMPEERRVPTWLEEELCDSMRDAADALMGRGGPALVINYLAQRLVPFGQKAIEHGDTDAVEVLGRTFIEMGSTERTFGVTTNFNISPLYESANLVLNYIDQKERVEAVKLLAASFFFLFTYVNFYTEGQHFTSSDHERFARELKKAGVNFPEVAALSRKVYEGYWYIRFANPDREEQRTLRKIKSL